MLLETALGYKSSWRIIGLLSETPAKPVARTDIKNYTMLGNEAVNSALKRLAVSGMLIKEKRGKKELYYLNMSNEFVKAIVELARKERAGLRHISFDALVILNEFARKALERTDFISRIIIFGSFAKGTARANSDMDIAVIEAEKNIRKEMIITEISELLSEQFKRKLQVHYFTEKDFKESASAIIKEVKEEGITLI